MRKDDITVETTSLKITDIPLIEELSNTIAANCCGGLANLALTDQPGGLANLALTDEFQQNVQQHQKDSALDDFGLPFELKEKLAVNQLSEELTQSSTLSGELAKSKLIQPELQGF
ncbi:hypothetical protein [Nostoc sp.]|uniref:hypothetical protein n=1 Tax=Nostoc sp. TaxID=1180 RepID=UPI002FF5E187